MARALKNELAPGTFFQLKRTWKSGATVELEFNQPITTPSVDAQHPNQIAIVRGPQVLFAIADSQPVLRQQQLAHLQLAKADQQDWALSGEPETIRLRPFAFIGDEIYQTYLRVV